MSSVVFYYFFANSKAYSGSGVRAFPMKTLKNDKNTVIVLRIKANAIGYWCYEAFRVAHFERSNRKAVFRHSLS